MSFWVALERDQQAILRASAALEQIWRDNCIGKFGQYLPHLEAISSPFGGGASLVSGMLLPL